MTPALPRKAKPQPRAASSVLDDLSTLLDGDLFAKPASMPYAPVSLNTGKPTLSDLCSSSSASKVSSSALDALARSNFEVGIERLA
ncbi:unnamed protein product [Heligmosomoides polygyrus]|uniref:Uncharacterized protein n=1 Tax=Heligmosomoides polygyrus TaxID=6339 RepID=A0A183F5W8_HELPZ|nr:unnamed protein product [Heligmosomoides polygyrus]